MLILSLILTSCSKHRTEDKIRIAVAVNFTEVMKDLAVRFEKKTGQKIDLIFGSTGKLYAQIENGAPFDAFFAADIKTPELLEQKGAIQQGSRLTYAVGKVVLWSPKPDFVDAEGQVLNIDTFRHLAIANPRLAPYGKAAEEIMRSMGIWDSLQSKLVTGENIGQTFQFVESGNAELGFVAYSQVKHINTADKGSYWDPPQSLYSPIEQQAVLLKDNSSAREFMTYVRSGEAREIIQRYGYSTP